jgi:transcriptional regulator with XRE-family HTH domain
VISNFELAEMKDEAYRHGVVNAQIEVDLPLEIRALRRQRGWKQPDLAERTGMKQPRISAMEKPGGANFTLETLKRLARAFDVALIVKFAPFSELFDWSDKFSPDEFSVASFDEELPVMERGALGDAGLTRSHSGHSNGVKGPCSGALAADYCTPWPAFRPSAVDQLGMRECLSRKPMIVERSASGGLPVTLAGAQQSVAGRD